MSFLHHDLETAARYVIQLDHRRLPNIEDPSGDNKRDKKKTDRYDGRMQRYSAGDVACL